MIDNSPAMYTVLLPINMCFGRPMIENIGVLRIFSHHILLGVSMELAMEMECVRKYSGMMFMELLDERM